MRIQIKILFLLLALSLQAQDKVDLSKALKVGQELPVLPDLPVLNYQSPKIDWGEINDKVIILDFFDTSCSNCIRDMPKLQKLQDELSDKLQIVLVTWQDKETIERFYANNAYLKKNKVHLPTIYGDTLLKSYFPHKGVPHTAWIFQNKVQATSFADFSKAENVEKLYNDGAVRLPIKNDFADKIVSSLTKTSELNRIGSVRILKGFNEEAKESGLEIRYDSLEDVNVSTINNLDVLGAYTSVLARLKKPTFFLKEERIVWSVKNADKYRYPINGEGKTSWLLINGINYERIESKIRTEEEIANAIISDLNMFLGLNVRWDNRKIPCLVLQSINNKLVQEEKESGLSSTDVLAFMIDYQGEFPPVVDEVKSKLRMEIKDYSSVETLNRQLEKYGLMLKEDMRELEVLVFEEVE
ncbi:redoxin domain-containing protein [Sphingobacterium sp. UT-1RO-CII-1]|uniref:TlpA family protein disulfide reductase n=1 Tax=Sphingobacterium sp. UT-1RO-CII-1 TaxID=2995225 RepID=UPI00227C1C92|nr:redoxin domain-containing protein [Sphingobacterium sp. UT-1RO-CII-1]MCY4779259.1 redoxin domain-containing protein [Sphingobacterium sp. UT-1RO-CII-1]